METALYYTFSTIPQTLAAALAILGAFLLSHLAHVNTELGEHLRDLKTRYGDDDTTRDLQALWSRGDVEDLLRYFSEDRLQRLGKEIRAFRLDRAHTLVRHRAALMYNVESVSTISVATIVASLIVIPLTPTIIGLPEGVRSTVFYGGGSGVAIVSAGYCLTRYAQFVRGIASAIL